MAQVIWAQAFDSKLTTSNTHLLQRLAAMSRDKIHALVAMLVGFGLGCVMIRAAGSQPLAVTRASVDMFSPQVRPSMALQTKFMPAVRASMPQQEEYEVASTESQTHTGRREVMGTFARAAVLGAVTAATGDRAAR